MITAPVIIISPPRSGSTLLLETLAHSPDLWTVGGESHRVVEGVPALHPRSRGWESNQLRAEDATGPVVRLLRLRFHAAVRDRDGQRPGSWRAPLRLLEKTPRNALRIPFLRRAFPAATFLYLHRPPAPTMSSMLEGWRSGRHVSYPRLPGWPGLPWSFLLVPGWRSLPPRELERVVAHQWRVTTAMLLDDLEEVPPQQRCSVRYDDLVSEPAAVVRALSERLGVRWDQPLKGALPLSTTTNTPPEPGKWRRHAAELEPMVEEVAAVAERAEQAAVRFGWS